MYSDDATVSEGKIYAKEFYPILEYEMIISKADIVLGVSSKDTYGYHPSSIFGFQYLESALIQHTG